MKKTIKKSKLQELHDRMQELNHRKLQAYKVGAGQSIMDQIDNMIFECQLDIEELAAQEQLSREDDDGESWIV